MTFDPHGPYMQRSFPSAVWVVTFQGEDLPKLALIQSPPPPCITVIPPPGEEHKSMMKELCELAEQGKFLAPLCKDYPLAEGHFQHALDNSMEPYIGTKQLLNMKR